MAKNVDAVGYTGDLVRNQIIPTPDGTLKAPENVITNVTAARTIYYKFRSEHLKRIQLYAAIEGLIAGNPPFDPADLRQHNLSHITNVNTLEAGGIFDKAALSYWNLLNETENICEFELNLPSIASDSVKWADILSKHWNNIVRSWPSFYTLVNTLTGQLVKFGISPIIWPDERDWQWRTIELSRFFIQDQAQSDIAQITAVCVETTFTAQHLMQIYNEFKGKPKKDIPWHIEELGRLLLFRANSTVKTDSQFLDVMDLQRRLQNGDVGWDAIFSDSIRMISLLYKEYDGKISHYMFDKFYDLEDFVYFADRQYNNLEEAMVIFTASPGVFTIHSNHGVGHKLFSLAQAIMQLDCSVVDMARLASTPFIKSPATGVEDFQPIRVYPGVPTNIGMAEFVQTNFGANIPQIINTSQYLSNKMNYNIANSGDDPSIPDKDKGSISPTQARLESFKEFNVLKNNIAHFYSQFDLVIQGMTVKMLDSKEGYPNYDKVKEWKDRCIEEGVPDLVFNFKPTKDGKMPSHMSVKASRVAGDGSTLARIMGLQELAPMAQSFGPKGLAEYKREYISAAYGNRYAKAFMADSQNPDELAGGASLAGVENVVMKFGEAATFSLDNEQRSHMSTHMALGENTIQALQQQQSDPVKADKIFTVLIPHMGQHFQALEKDPFQQEFVKGIKPAWDQLETYAKLNRKNAAAMIQAQIQKDQQAQEAQTTTMSDIQRKDTVAAADIKRSDIKVQSQVERAKEANQTRADVMREKVQKDADNQRLKVQLDAEAKKGNHKDSSANVPESTLRNDLSAINGATPSPYDIKIPKI